MAPLPIIEFVPQLVYYMALASDPAPSTSTIYFSIDTKLQYNSLHLDFGPLNLACTIEFCTALDTIVRSARQTHRQVVFYSSLDARFRANAACLLCCWGVLSCAMRPEDAVSKFASIAFPPFHDASPHECTYNLTISDCVCGLERAVQLGYVRPSAFDVREYRFFEQVEHGDLSWISPKFVAFAGPQDTYSATPDGYVTLTPEHYISYFKQRDVTLVVRLNAKQYDERKFTSAGIAHLDLMFPDASCPPAYLLEQFINACETTPGAVAVHCTAGLGRTGTCIAAYLMKHGQMTSKEAIAWLRLCRPGSVIGRQQQYLDTIQPKMWRAAHDNNNNNNNDAPNYCSSNAKRLIDHAATSLFRTNIVARESKASVSLNQRNTSALGIAAMTTQSESLRQQKQRHQQRIVW